MQWFKSPGTCVDWSNLIFDMVKTWTAIEVEKARDMDALTMIESFSENVKPLAIDFYEGFKNVIVSYNERAITEINSLVSECMNILNDSSEKLL